MSTLQHSYGFTVADSATLVDATKSSSCIFRVGASTKKETSLSGESAYLSFTANSTNTIIIPINYSSADRCRFVAECDGTFEVTVTHPTLGAQILTAKSGSVVFSMRMTAISITEMAGAAGTIKWSLFQVDSTDPEAFA
jgi:hypothetical protein